MLGVGLTYSFNKEVLYIQGRIIQILNGEGRFRIINMSLKCLSSFIETFLCQYGYLY